MKEKDSDIYFEQGENYNIPNESEVTYTDYDEKVEIKHSWRKSDNLKKFKRIDKDHYVDTETGEIKEYNKEGKFKSDKNISNSMKRLRDLILYNFKGANNELFITLTFRGKAPKKLSKIRRFIKYFFGSLKRKFPQRLFQYIYKFERKKGQKWHIHILLKDINSKNLFIDNDIIHKIWKKGFTKTVRVKNGKSSMSKANGKLSKEDEDTLKELENINVSGRYGIADYMCKKNQLYEFPKDERIFGYGGGIRFPPKYKMTYEEAMEKVKDYDFERENTTLVKSHTNENIVNIHKTEHYKKKK